MADYCAECGRELRDDAQHCPACGKPLVGEAVKPAQSTPYEYCEIRYSYEGSSSNWIGYFWVAATGPSGIYKAGASSTCKGESRRDGNVRYVGPSQQCGKAFRQLLQTLELNGWEQLPDKGPYYWNLKFRRALKQ